MEIYIPNIPKIASLSDVERALRQELHTPGFSPGAPVNFHVRLFLDKQGRSRGMGILALPEATGRVFLQKHGSSSGVYISSIRLQFRPNNRAPDRSILQRVTTEPYRDRQQAEERERVAREVESSTVRMQRLQFGWDRRDSTFSIEWEYRPTSPSAGISFLPELRQMVITVEQDVRILIAYSQIAYISWDDDAGHSDAGVIFLSLHYPPHFLQQTSVLFGEPEWRRLSALPVKDTLSQRSHDRVSGFLSTSIRLVCLPTGPAKFRRLCRQAELNITITHDRYPSRHANLFSDENLGLVRAWTLELPSFYAYLIESLLASGAVDPSEMLALRVDIEQLFSDGRKRGVRGREYVVMVLRDFEQKAQNLWDIQESGSIIDCLMQCKQVYNQSSKCDVLTKREDPGIFLCFHIIVTPTRTLYEGPIPERSNRVVRTFPAAKHGYFVRVTFVEEGKLKHQYSKDYNYPLRMQQHVGAILKNGLVIAGRRFKFLGYSQSALKNHSTWFLRPFKDSAGATVDVSTIIQSLGTFSDLSFDARLMYCPARYAARISQAFTTTEPTTTVVENLETVDDIIRTDRSGTKWNFTDGVGTMSPAFARRIHAARQVQRRGLQFDPDDYPRALQIRFMGSKGMLSVDHTLSGMAVGLRQSMIKFTGKNTDRLEIAQVFDKPGKIYLNRPLIVLLEGLGVPYSVFKEYQDEAVKAVNESTTCISRAGFFLAAMGLGTSFRFPATLMHLAKLGASDPTDLFYSTAIQYARNDALRELKHKSRIPVPGAWNLVGVADVHDFLKPNEIFACVKPLDSERVYLQGPVLITRSPTIHPGDVQVVEAIGRPPPGSCFDIEPLQNTVVFSTQGMFNLSVANLRLTGTGGTRPISSYLGGGDLDGDEYTLIPLDKHPGFTITARPPAAYLPAKRKELYRHCTHADIAEFYTDYIVSDNLGYISLTWRIIADQRGIFDPDCLKLADLHSQAVDYPKSGLPVSIVDVPRRPLLLPDWHAPETMTFLDPEKYYESQKAIGKLFREIALPVAQYETSEWRRKRGVIKDDGEPRDPFSQTYKAPPVLNRSAPTSIIRLVWRRVIAFLPDGTPLVAVYSDMRDLFLAYRSRLQSICTTHTLSRSRGAMLTEEEAFIGTIVANTSQPTKRLDHISKIREETTMLVEDVRESLIGSAEISLEQRLYRAYFAWMRAIAASTEKEMFGLRSFGWIALSVVFDTMKEMEAKSAELEGMRNALAEINVAS